MQFKDFNEVKNSNRPFYQIYFYDRRKKYTSDTETLYFSTKKEVKIVLGNMERYNKMLFDSMLWIYKPFGVTSENYKNCEVWNSIVQDVKKSNLLSSLTEKEKRLFRYDKDTIGYCFIRVYRRDLKQEKRDEEREIKKYRKTSYNDCSNDGPYGGAFKDYNDFYMWKEG